MDQDTGGNTVDLSTFPYEELPAATNRSDEHTIQDRPASDNETINDLPTSNDLNEKEAECQNHAADAFASIYDGVDHEMGNNETINNLQTSNELNETEAASEYHGGDTSVLVYNGADHEMSNNVTINNLQTGNKSNEEEAGSEHHSGDVFLSMYDRVDHEMSDGAFDHDAAAFGDLTLEQLEEIERSLPVDEDVFSDSQQEGKQKAVSLSSTSDDEGILPKSRQKGKQKAVSVLSLTSDDKEVFPVLRQKGKQKPISSSSDEDVRPKSRGKGKQKSFSAASTADDGTNLENSNKSFWSVYPEHEEPAVYDDSDNDGDDEDEEKKRALSPPKRPQTPKRRHSDEPAPLYPPGLGFESGFGLGLGLGLGLAPNSPQLVVEGLDIHQDYFLDNDDEDMETETRDGVEEGEIVDPGSRFPAMEKSPVKDTKSEGSANRSQVPKEFALMSQEQLYFWKRRRYLETDSEQALRKDPRFGKTRVEMCSYLRLTYTAEVEDASEKSFI